MEKYGEWAVAALTRAVKTAAQTAVALAALVASAQPHGVSQPAPAVTAAVTVSDRPCETVIVIEGALP